MAKKKRARTPKTWKKLRPRQSISCERALRNIKPPPPPPGVPSARWKATRKESGDSLSWYRGEHAGIHSAFLTLRDEYPEAAKALIAAFNMNERGIIELRAGE